MEEIAAAERNACVDECNLLSDLWKRRSAIETADLFRHTWVSFSQNPFVSYSFSMQKRLPILRV